MIILFCNQREEERMHTLQNSTTDADPLWSMVDLSSYQHQIVATVAVVKNYSQPHHQKHLAGATLLTTPVATYTFLVICK